MAWSAKQYEIERVENVLAYLRLKDRLERRERGKWVAIARGRLAASADTIQRAIADASKQEPRVMHRFVFRVGVRRPNVSIRQITETECKDEKQCGNNLINKTALGKLLQKQGGKLEDDYEKNRTCITLNGKTVCWKWQGKKLDEHWEELGCSVLSQCIEIVVDKPGTNEKKTVCALLDSGCLGSFIVLDPSTYLDTASTTEDVDDTQQATTPGGKVDIRHGYPSFEIPQVGFSMAQVAASASKDAVKDEVDRRKSAEEEKKKKEEEDAKKAKNADK